MLKKGLDCSRLKEDACSIEEDVAIPVNLGHRHAKRMRLFLQLRPYRRPRNPKFYPIALTLESGRVCRPVQRPNAGA